MFVLKEGKVTLSTMEGFVYGAIARAISTIIMYPFLLAKTLMQASTKEGEDDAPKTMMECFSKLIKKEGIMGLYKGVQSELLRGVISSAVTMMMKERIYALNRGFFLKLAAANNKPSTTAAAPITAGEASPEATE